MTSLGLVSEKFHNGRKYEKSSQKVKGHNQMSPKCKHFEFTVRNTYSDQVTSISDHYFFTYCADRQTDTHTHRGKEREKERMTQKRTDMPKTKLCTAVTMVARREILITEA